MVEIQQKVSANLARTVQAIGNPSNPEGFDLYLRGYADALRWADKQILLDKLAQHFRRLGMLCRFGLGKVKLGDFLNKLKKTTTKPKNKTKRQSGKK